MAQSEQATGLVPTLLDAGRDLTLAAGRDLSLVATQASAARDMALIAGRDVIVTAGEATFAAAERASSASASVGIGITASARGVDIGVTLEGGASGSRRDVLGSAFVNSDLVAGERLLVSSGADTLVAGARIAAREVDLLVGGDLRIASLADTGRTRGSSWNAGGSLTIGLVGPSSLSLSVGSGRERADSLWVSEQTAIIAEDRLFAGVGGHTQIDGALIAARSGVLLIDTRTLGFSDIEERIVERVQDVQLGVNLGWGGDQTGTERPGQGLPGATLSGQLASRDVERITRATVGPGQIVVRDEEAQTQDLAALNRDLDRAQEVIRDEAAGVRFYASDTAIRELASGFATTRANLEANRALFEYGLSGLTEEIARSVAEAAAMLGLQGLSVEEAQQAIVAAQVASGAISAEEAAQIAAILELLATNDPATAYASLSAGIVDGVPVSPETIARAFATAGAAGTTGAVMALAVAATFVAAVLYNTPVGARIDHTEDLADGSKIRIVGGGSETQLTMSVRSPSGEQTLLVLSRMPNGAYALVGAGIATAGGQIVPIDPRTVLDDARAFAGAIGGGFQATAQGGLVVSTPGTGPTGPTLVITTAIPDPGLSVSTPIQQQGSWSNITFPPGYTFPLTLEARNNVPENAVTASELAGALRLSEARSPWLPSGELRPEAIAGATQVIAPERLNNPQIPLGFGKFETPTIQSPAGPFRVHFYMNSSTGEVFYDLDYKVVFNHQGNWRR
ncbi:hemagglutinin repeat-containing protein [Salinarimonas sp.]|uniref:hemagglutinin repeat-containing protein n=1 Tax=Salinarimonas sp. TaxID=2766526 RepID=UPI00391DED30